jgi:hypothetical protein
MAVAERLFDNWEQVMMAPQGYVSEGCTLVGLLRGELDGGKSSERLWVSLEPY